MSVNLKRNERGFHSLFIVSRMHKNHTEITYWRKAGKNLLIYTYLLWKIYSIQIISIISKSSDSNYTKFLKAKKTFRSQR